MQCWECIASQGTGVRQVMAEEQEEVLMLEAPGAGQAAV